MANEGLRANVFTHTPYSLVLSSQQLVALQNRLMNGFFAYAGGSPAS